MLREASLRGGEEAAAGAAVALPDDSLDGLAVEEERGAAAEGFGAGWDLVVVRGGVDDGLLRAVDLDARAGCPGRVAVRDGLAAAEDPVRVGALLLAEGDGFACRDDLEALDPREGAAGCGDADRGRDVVRGGVLSGAAWDLRLRSASGLDVPRVAGAVLRLAVLRPVVLRPVAEEVRREVAEVLLPVVLRVRLSVRIRRGSALSTWRVAGSRRAEALRLRPEFWPCAVALRREGVAVRAAVCRATRSRSPVVARTSCWRNDSRRFPWA